MPIRTTPRSPVTLASGALLACIAPGFAFAQGVQVRTIALSGEQAPGTPAGVVFSAFDNGFSINADGRVAMSATLAGAGVTATNNAGLWWDVPGTLELVMRTGDPAPGQPSLNYFTTNAPNLSDSGTIVYGALIKPAVGGTRSSLWTVSATIPAAAFLVGSTQVPGLPAGVLWNDANIPHINAGGSLAFRGLLGGTGVGSGHWVGSPNTLSLVALDGSPTGLIPGVNFAGVANDYQMNSAGMFVFGTSLAGSSVTGSNDLALWQRSPAGVVSLVAREGDQVPGMAPGVVYASLSTSSLNTDSTGRLVFNASLSGPGFTSTNDAVVLSHDSGVITLLAQEGTQAPGVAAGVLWGGSFSVTLGGQSTVVLKATLTGPGVVTANGSGIWKSTNAGPFTLVARAGSPAPGTSPVRNFDSFTVNTANIATNALGRIMLAAPLTTSAEGIWLEDATGTLHLALLEGTPFDINDDPNITVLKTAAALGFPPPAGADDGRRNAFGDTGEVAFRLAFTDGTSGAFVAGLPQDCDSIDFNNDSLFPDTADIDDFLSVFSGGPCTTDPTPGCNDIDFNNDSLFPDTLDIDSLLSVFSGGPCL